MFQWIPVILSQSDFVTVISSQSDYVTGGILKTEKSYLPTILYYCISKIEALVENSSHKHKLVKNIFRAVLP